MNFVTTRQSLSKLNFALAVPKFSYLFGYYFIRLFAMRYGLVTRRPAGRLYIKKRTALVGSPLLAMMVDVDAYSAR